MRRSGISTGMLLMIILLFLNRLRSGIADPSAFLYDILITLPGIIIGIAFHEFGHAFVADRLGDPLPRSQGRVTLNPLAHIDPFGLITLIFAGFGWGKPVMIDPNAYKHPRRDRLLVSFAGVIMNAIVILVLALITRAVWRMPYSNQSVWNTVLDILIQAIAINVMLMLFNLLPVPPLDGFNIVTEILDLRSQSWYRNVYNAGGILLMVIIVFGLTGRILTPAVQGIFRFVINHIIL